MKFSVPKETKLKENRVALTPDVVKGLVKKGFEIMVEAGAGINSFYADDSYTAAGASIVDKNKCYSDADVVLKVNAPQSDEISLMKKEAILISFMFADHDDMFAIYQSEDSRSIRFNSEALEKGSDHFRITNVI